jgi:hypothetical protein
MLTTTGCRRLAGNWLLFSTGRPLVNNPLYFFGKINLVLLVQVFGCNPGLSLPIGSSGQFRSRSLASIAGYSGILTMKMRLLLGSMPNLRQSRFYGLYNPPPLLFLEFFCAVFYYRLVVLLSPRLNLYSIFALARVGRCMLKDFTSEGCRNIQQKHPDVQVVS